MYMAQVQFFSKIFIQHLKEPDIQKVFVDNFNSAVKDDIPERRVLDPNLFHLHCTLSLALQHNVGNFILKGLNIYENISKSLKNVLN